MQAMVCFGGTNDGRSIEVNHWVRHGERFHLQKMEPLPPTPWSFAGPDETVPLSDTIETYRVFVVCWHGERKTSICLVLDTWSDADAIAELEKRRQQ